MANNIEVNMRVFRLREKLGRRGLMLVKHGDIWRVTNEGTAKTLIEHDFANLDEVEAWVKDFNQCDGCRRGLPLDENGVHHGDGRYDMIGCTRRRYNG